MTDSVFGTAYSSLYDLIYFDKDYESECELIEEAFNNFSNISVKRILDLGCGTGNHAWRLARRGYQVIGIDLSESMLRLACQKKETFPLPRGKNPPLFLRGDIRNFNFQIKFDAILAMFAVLGYLPKNKDVMAVIERVEKHLVPGGLFLADFWYGPAVEAIRPESRKKLISIGQGKILREARSKLYPKKHHCLVHYHLVIQNEKGEMVKKFEEKHLIRYFFPDEIKTFLSLAGLNFLELSAFGNLRKPADASTWNVFLVAQKPKNSL
ncbi:MAG: class I SAM-dependent methyltransferase [Candidatus Aminicenantes bacterium]|nr:class I SAM-dependent methyltransferase [Candidatus Aminicenantes bacterium]